MSVDNFFAYQKAFLDFATNELTSHGAMLFAVLSSSFILLRIINDRIKNRDYIMPFFNKIIFGTFLSLLLGVTSYVFSRLLYYGILVNSIYVVSFDDFNFTLDNFTFNNYSSYVFSYARNNIPKELKIFMTIVEFAFIKRIIINLIIGYYLSILLMYSIDALWYGILLSSLISLPISILIQTYLLNNIVLFSIILIFFITTLYFYFWYLKAPKTVIEKH